MNDKMKWFLDARFGLFVHYGLYSMLERGEWVMNRERISSSELEILAQKFNPSGFDAHELCKLALNAKAKYICLTTMHHEGFRLYESKLSDFNSVSYCGRNLVAEMVESARAHGLRISLYHSLNNWYDKPDLADALESKENYEACMRATHARIKELIELFPDIDCLWYDGWWPFDANGWKAEEMNAMVRAINPNIIFNGRNGLPGDFGTPEGHMSPPSPWRPWEACITGNDNWGFHAGDHEWKTPVQIIKMLASAAQGKGNLLFNIGPRGDGSIPPQSYQQLREVGQWLSRHGEAIFVNDTFTYSLREREYHQGDWSHNGPFTRNGNTLYQIVPYWCGHEITIAGLSAEPTNITLLSTGQHCDWIFNEGVLRIANLPVSKPDPYAAVIKLEFEEVPQMYLTGGMRIPNAKHPCYDPIESDIQH